MESKTFNPPPPPKCPTCGSVMKLRETTKYKFENGENRKFFGCSNYPKCQVIFSLHSDGRIKNIPADAETRKLRMEAHDVFDKIWLTHKLMKRKEAYRLLQDMMDMKEAPHIGHMNKEQCETLIERVTEYLNDNVQK